MQVAQQGEAILSLRSQEISVEEITCPWIQALIKEMQSTMEVRQGVGIAAPQVYVSRRVIIVASRANARYPDAPDMPAIAMINPEIIYRSEKQLLGEEGCLSVPEQRGSVARAADIRVRYCNELGDIIEQDFSGFPARIVQHEIDHLDGILFVDRVTPNTMALLEQ